MDRVGERIFSVETTSVLKESVRNNNDGPDGTMDLSRKWNVGALFKIVERPVN